MKQMYIILSGFSWGVSLFQTCPFRAKHVILVCSPLSHNLEPLDYFQTMPGTKKSISILPSYKFSSLLAGI